jgi:predicted SAM-dependent methyltransferase
MKYDLGGIGKNGKYITVNLIDDCDIKHDITDLDGFISEDNSIDEFKLIHTLEHIPIIKYKNFLYDLKRKLKVKGKIIVVLTDAEAVIKQWINGKLSFRAMKKTLFPPSEWVKDNPFMSHQNMWSEADLIEDFESVGFFVKTFDAGYWDYDLPDEFFPESQLKYWAIDIKNIGIEAYKLI